jgi:hypothetical protein
MKKTLFLCAGLVLGFALRLGASEFGPLAFTAVQNGDVNGDWGLDLSDPVYLLSHLFLGGPAPAPALAALCPEGAPALANGDANGDGAIDISDGIRMLAWLFGGDLAPLPFACDSGVAVDMGVGAGQGGTDRPIAWLDAGSFAVAPLPEGPLVFAGSSEDLHVTHLGLSSSLFSLVAAFDSPTSIVLVEGSFVLTAANGDELRAVLTAGAADLLTGEYFLDYDFRGGTGRFADARGRGRAEGFVDVFGGVYQARDFGRISY